MNGVLWYINVIRRGSGTLLTLDRYSSPMRSMPALGGRSHTSGIDAEDVAALCLLEVDGDLPFPAPTWPTSSTRPIGGPGPDPDHRR
jgi:hypothetical protein